MVNKSTKIRTLGVKLESVELILTHPQDRTSEKSHQLCIEMLCLLRDLRSQSANAINTTALARSLSSRGKNQSS